MKNIVIAAAVGLLAIAPAFAQSGQYNEKASGLGGHNWPKPVDHGPYNATANQAYQGGGVILQGAPGAPAPRPEPTPPGQMPRNMVTQ